MKRTESETLFEEFCRSASLPLVPIPTESGAGRRTPDYELRVEDPPILVELKQIDPNAEEREVGRAYITSGGPLESSSTPGERLRSKISQAARQLRARCTPNQAGLVAVYNNVWFRPSFTAEHNVLAAMYGRLAFRLTVPKRGPTVSEPRLAGNRALNRATNTVVSAVAILSHNLSEWELLIYHNNFARVPISPDLLRRPRIQQFRRLDSDPGEFPGWQAV